MKIDHKDRMQLVILSLEGLSVGDALGRQLFLSDSTLEQLLPTDPIPAKPWEYSDDTEMALAIAEVLNKFQHIDQDALAMRFAQRFHQQPERGYGPVAYWILSQIDRGLPWKEVSTSVYNGTGSKGNGAAMRVAPIGAYFYDDLDQVALQAAHSAEITHAHLDGQAGAIAIAIAAALACNYAQHNKQIDRDNFLETTLNYLPKSETCDLIKHSLTLKNVSAQQAAIELGTGKLVISADSVPLALWCAAAHLDSYQEAMATLISGLSDAESDSDTLAAMIGSIVVLSAGKDSIPSYWLNAREPLDYQALFQDD